MFDEGGCLPHVPVAQWPVQVCLSIEPCHPGQLSLVILLLVDEMSTGVKALQENVILLKWYISSDGVC